MIDNGLSTFIVAAANEAGATRVTPIDPTGIRYYTEVRHLCERNACGAFGKNWQCPPHVGSVAETSARAKRYACGVVVQSVGVLEDSYDIEGMGREQKVHQDRLRAVGKRLRVEHPDVPFLLLGAGPCDVCSRCTVLDGEPCRFPDRIMPSMESYGMNVKEVVESVGLPYISGKNTVTYSGLILYGNAAE